MFNLMETFFFISLGITFVLILLLVYHFKQRLTAVEQKSDTMFDIINNIVKEMAVIKTMAIEQNMVQQNIIQHFQQVQQFQYQHFQDPSVGHPYMQELPVQQSQENVEGSTNYDIPMNMYVSDLQDHNQNPQYVEKNNEDDDDDDEDDDNEDDDDDDEEYEDDDEDEDDDENEKVIVSDNEDEIELDDVQQEIELDVQVQVENSDADIVEVVDIDTHEKYIEVPEPVKNIEVLTPELVSNDDYNKYSISELKALVMKKGLSSDASKMKKPKLLSLLNSA